MTPEQLENLKQLRVVIEKAPADLLHMRAFHESASCGTAHCALGWASIDPKLGPKLARECFTHYSPDTLIYDFWGMLKLSTPEVFGIELEDAYRLFATGIDGDAKPHSIRKSEVLWNIDELIAGRHAMPYRAIVRAHRRARPGWGETRFRAYDGPCAAGR